MFSDNLIKGNQEVVISDMEVHSSTLVVLGDW